MSVDSTGGVDPRIKIELERLNTATETINQYEIQVDEARREFHALLKESIDKIKQSATKIGNAIEIAKPYYEARLYCNQVGKEVLEAQATYDKSKSTLAAAKEMVNLAEQGLGEKNTLDVACQEMLSHATSRVNESQAECTEARNNLKMCELKQDVANTRVTKLQTQLKGAIRASRPYYETRANCNGLLKAQKAKILEMESKILNAKMTYNEALKNLEEISEEIHRLREETKTKLEEYDSSKKPLIAKNKENAPSLNDKQELSSQINSTDEYLEFPPKLSLKSSPIKQQIMDKHECPHLLRDFDFGRASTAATVSSATSSPNKYGCDRTFRQDDSDGEMFSPSQTDMTNLSDIEHWTEIRLSHSNSNTSTEHSAVEDIQSPVSNYSETSSERSDNARRKVITKVIRYDEDLVDKEPKKAEGLSSWLSRSSFKAEGRRQSFDLLLDNTKEIFSGITKTLERRNSESEMTVNNDFFSFGKQALTDEQVENLQLDAEHPELEQGFKLSTSKHKMLDISKSK
ncbi:SH3 domain-binding protein 5-like isoform X2 [Culicoides brevitarsis]|uniref:SH3 domain-binding protein 5-like isoform X2 n=1 Tax=Culicoides brevitarsis TaxID=469753 RepID=UPI00307B9801